MDKENSEENSDVKIVIERDGPYKVCGNVPITRACICANEEGDSVGWKTGDAYPRDEECSLCRCGHSRAKPFCDGSHNDAEFVGTEHADRPPYAEKAKRIRGETVDMLDDTTLCVGARFCDAGRSAWGYVERSGDARARKRAIEEAGNCPAGRLTIIEKDGTPIEPELTKEIAVIEDPANDCRGPLWVKGGIPVEGACGERYETRNRVALCRCGGSRNQPYCDGSHYNNPEMRGL